MSFKILEYALKLRPICERNMADTDRCLRSAGKVVCGSEVKRSVKPFGDVRMGIESKHPCFGYLSKRYYASMSVATRCAQVSQICTTSTTTSTSTTASTSTTTTTKTSTTLESALTSTMAIKATIEQVQMLPSSPAPLDTDGGLVASSFSYSSSNTTTKKKEEKVKKRSVTAKKQQWYNQYKMIQGTNIIVDGFTNCSKLAPKNAIYFLSHFHSDHYAGLNKGFNQGLIYASATTCRLAERILGVSRKYLMPLPPFERHKLEESTPRTWVTLLEANHCPGAVMFLFEVEVEQDSQRREYYLHCGDFRCDFDPCSWFQQCNSLLLRPFSSRQMTLHRIYLDTTYCLKQVNLPKQSDSIRYVSG
ncbi:hypothetical protein RFI_15577 [Reticulomyxa filosa]|uniref:Uncharacterized protein n=1 Tax=Reticulomyxa filosa TaxID=46433 RepID=X6N6F5_RETFI|nr:hypothetical protein RFI_15577 [Reticulomyxa filosa]|eukprot:ETO21626.1 hypothetical protein RFI_15577 [Reticulomyxa filosa]